MDWYGKRRRRRSSNRTEINGKTFMRIRREKKVGERKKEIIRFFLAWFQRVLSSTTFTQ